MIHCRPRSICSWDFSATGLSSGSATVEYDWLTEQGKMVIGHHEYDIRKHGVFSGHWTYELHGRLLADARKPSAMFRTFEISSSSAGMNLVLQAESALLRAFEIVLEEQVVGRISPAHPFTRRATIQCADVVPEHLQLFAFWLAGLTWKRSAQSSSSS
jgi:hypothetical protein